MPLELAVVEAGPHLRSRAGREGLHALFRAGATRTPRLHVLLTAADTASLAASAPALVLWLSNLFVLHPYGPEGDDGVPPLMTAAQAVVAAHLPTGQALLVCPRRGASALLVATELAEKDRPN